MRIGTGLLALVIGLSGPAFAAPAPAPVEARRRATPRTAPRARPRPVAPSHRFRLPPAPADPPARQSVAPASSAARVRGKGPPPTRLSLETDPPQLLQMAPSRAVYLWPASPRLRTGAWIATHFYVEPAQVYRRYDPEFLYEKQDTFVVAQVGGAFRLGPMELNLAIPFVGLIAADFYEKGVIDREVRKIDRADMRIGFKYGFRIEQGRDLWLITPNIAVSAPTQSRDRYNVSLGGHPVTHFTSPGRSVGVLPGLATGWRRGWWSVVFSIGALVTVPVNTDAEREERFEDPKVEVDLVGAYQVGFSPFRDLSFTLALMHMRRLSEPVKEQFDLFWLAPGLRLQPYQGLFGHLGLMFPISERSINRVPTMILLQAGWEFR